MQPDSIAADAVRVAVVAGDIDDRQLDPLVREAPTQRDAGFSIQVDVQDDAKSLAEIAMAEQRTAPNRTALL